MDARGIKKIQMSGTYNLALSIYHANSKCREMAADGVTLDSLYTLNRTRLKPIISANRVIWAGLDVILKRLILKEYKVFSQMKNSSFFVTKLQLT